MDEKEKTQPFACFFDRSSVYSAKKSRSTHTVISVGKKKKKTSKLLYPEKFILTTREGTEFDDDRA